MQTADPLIRTKLHLPFTRPALVPRPRLQAQIGQGLRGPLTLITAPAGFGKTTLVEESVAGLKSKVTGDTSQPSTCRCQPAIVYAWLSLDKDDNQLGRFLRYLLAALQEGGLAVGGETVRLLEARPALQEAILASLINVLDADGRETALVLDDYQFIRSRAVHSAVAFLLEHCPTTFHLVIAARSDPPLPLTRLRARGQAVELRAADLRFTVPEAAQFLNDVMRLHLDAGSVAALAERTEGWIAGLQMAALSMRDREDVTGFIEGFSGTNRYILDYLLEEVLASQPPDIQRFLLCTSILDRLTAPLCEAITESRESRTGSRESRMEIGDDSRISTLDPRLSPLDSQSILEYLERANLFLVPLDDERRWYRYHHLFADLLRAQLFKSCGAQGVASYHLRAAEWHEQNGSILEAIHHASLASDFERIERLIEQNYFEMMNRGEMALVRSWMGELSKEEVIRRPWLCLYEAFRHSWFGQLEAAQLWLAQAEDRIQSANWPDRQAMLGYHAYVRSRVTAMQGDTRQAIELCLAARANIPAGNLALHIETGITLGYEYFLVGDFASARQTLYEMIRSCFPVDAINNPVAAYALLARIDVLQGRLHDALELYQKSAQLIREAGGQYPGAIGLEEVGIAALLCEWNDLAAALARVKRGLDCLPSWGKTDDLCLATITLARIQLALGNQAEAVKAVEEAAQMVQTCGVFTEASREVEAAQVKWWLAQGDWPAVDRWMAALPERFGSPDPLRYEDELIHLALARVHLARNRPEEAWRVLSDLEESARSGGRQGRLVEITLLQALALEAMGKPAQALVALEESLALAEPEGYVRVFLDEGQPMRTLLAQYLAPHSPGPLRDYAARLLSQFAAGPQPVAAAQQMASPAGSLVEPLSPREQEVLQLIALGKTNQEIARQLIVSPGTVKAHTASIYRKLDVANRTEAAARARQLGLLA